MLRRWGPLAAVLGIQLAILVVIPYRRVEARLRGTEITLRTMPVDPYDVLSGYYVTLRYEVEPTRADLVAQPYRWLTVARSEPAWVGAGLSPAPREHASRPDTVELKIDPDARARGESCLIASACRFYIPEARREQVSAAMRETGGRALVDMRVDDDGNVALVRLRVGTLVLAN
jgi:uncharacterized membrane-anchored protein